MCPVSYTHLDVYKRQVLMILDGFGLNEKQEANAIYEAKTPNLDQLMKDYPFVKGYALSLIHI